MLDRGHGIEGNFVERGIAMFDGELAMLQSRSIEQVVDQRSQMPHLPLRNGQDFNRFFVFRTELDGCADCAVDRRHRVSKLVPEHRYKFTMPTLAFLAGIT